MCHRLNAVENSNDSRDKLQSLLPDAARYSRARRIAMEAAVLAPPHDIVVFCLPLLPIRFFALAGDFETKKYGFFQAKKYSEPCDTSSLCSRIRQNFLEGQKGLF